MMVIRRQGENEGVLDKAFTILFVLFDWFSVGIGAGRLALGDGGDGEAGG